MFLFKRDQKDIGVKKHKIILKTVIYVYSFMHRKDSIIKTGFLFSNLLTGEDAAFHR